MIKIRNYLGSPINTFRLKSYLYRIKDQRKIKLLLLLLLLLKHLQTSGAPEKFWSFFVRDLRRIFLSLIFII